MRLSGSLIVAAPRALMTFSKHLVTDGGCW